MTITHITTPHFKIIVIYGILSNIDKKKILTLKKKLSYDEYAGYSPDQQAIYTDIKKIASKYPQHNIITI